MKNVKKQKKSGFYAVYRTFRLILSESPSSFFIKLVIALTVGATGSLLTPANAYLFSSAEKVVTGAGEVSQIAVGAALVISAMLASKIINTVSDLSVDKTNQKMTGVFNRYFYKKVANIPAIRFETPSFLQAMNKAAKSSGILLAEMDIWVRTFGSVISYFIITAGILISMDFTLVLALFFTFFPSIFLNLILPSIEEKSGDEARPYDMRREQYRENSRDAYDTRIFGAFSFFDKLYYQNSKKAYEIWRKAELKIRWITIAFQLTKAAGWVGVLLLLVRLIGTGRISAGEGTAVFASVSTMYSYFETLFSCFRRSSEVEPYVNSFFTFVDEAEEGAEKEAVVPDVMKYGIQAENISFTYPESDRRAIEGVNLNIRPGELVAVVGANGSGKTTLSKLLMGLYTPDEGKVVIGGREAKNTTREALFKKTSALFQNFNKYTALTLSDNVRISSTDKEYTSESITSVLSDCSLDANDEKTFPQGLDTMLGRRFNGSELSGGQWQRLAMARGFYRDSDWLVLDEPTSAIDALEEDRMYRRFAEIAKGKTALFITHRLGSARIADRIIVMDGGKIVEEGTHEELLARKGKYTEMWEAQASGYIE